MVVCVRISLSVSQLVKDLDLKAFHNVTMNDYVPPWGVTARQRS